MSVARRGVEDGLLQMGDSGGEGFDEAGEERGWDSSGERSRGLWAWLWVEGLVVFAMKAGGHVEGKGVRVSDGGKLCFL